VIAWVTTNCCFMSEVSRITRDIFFFHTKKLIHSYSHSQHSKIGIKNYFCNIYSCCRHNPLPDLIYNFIMSKISWPSKFSGVINKGFHIKICFYLDHFYKYVELYCAGKEITPKTRNQLVTYNLLSSTKVVYVLALILNIFSTCIKTYGNCSSEVCSQYLPCQKQ
jgi:hypothetical protein